MFQTTVFFKKFILIGLLALMAWTVLPIQSVSAAALTDEPTPGKNQGAPARLKRAFRLLERRVERQGRRLERSDALIEKAQNLIDRAAEKGLDASPVQAALDVFKAALPNAKTAHAQAAAIAEAHTGFDDTGAVTDPEAARATIEELRTALQATHQAMNGSGKTLLQAVRDFLKATNQENP